MTPFWHRLQKLHHSTTGITATCQCGHTTTPHDTQHDAVRSLAHHITLMARKHQKGQNA